MARLSEINLSLYRTFMQPAVRALANQPTADLNRALNPLRLGYTLFADKNPWMGPVRKLAVEAVAAREPVPSDNPFLALQTRISGRITAGLDAYRVVRDQLSEQMFFAFYGSRSVQALLGINAESEVRPVAALSSEDVMSRRAKAQEYEAMLKTGGIDEALTRAVLYVMAAERTIDQRCALALNLARQRLMHLSLAQFKALVRDQFFVLQLEPRRAVEALATLVPDAAARKELAEAVNAIVGAGDVPLAAGRDRLARVATALEMLPEKRLAAVASGRILHCRSGAGSDAARQP